MTDLTIYTNCNVMTVIIVRASRYIIARYPSLLLIEMFRLRLNYLAVGII